MLPFLNWIIRWNTRIHLEMIRSSQSPTVESASWLVLIPLVSRRIKPSVQQPTPTQEEESLLKES